MFFKRRRYKKQVRDKFESLYHEVLGEEYKKYLNFATDINKNLDKDDYFIDKYYNDGLDFEEAAIAHVISSIMRMEEIISISNPDSRAYKLTRENIIKSEMVLNLSTISKPIRISLMNKKFVNEARKSN